MAYDKRALVGIGGWLAFFLITLVLNAIGSLAQVGTLSTLPDLAAQYGSTWSVYLGIGYALVAAQVGGYAYLAWRLNARQTADTPRIVIIGLGTLAVMPSVIDAAAGVALLGIDLTASAGPLVVPFGRRIVYAAIWSAYLLQSERVANTYTDDPAAADFD